MNMLNDEISSASILIVDDTPENLNILSAILKKKGYNVRPVPNGELALKAAENMVPDLILLDILMPGMNGFEVCQELKKNEKLREIPVIFISALSEIEDKVKAFSIGGVDYITKPFQIEEVNARVETHLKLRKLTTHLEHIVEKQVAEISSSQMSTIIAMAKLAQSRDDCTGKHLDRVREYCYLIAGKLSESPRYKSYLNAKWIDIIAKASALHDIGKVGIPDGILLKEGKLSDHEFKFMKMHSIIGADTIKEVQESYPENKFISTGVTIARWHHERWDGTGYPDGLKGKDIPLPARIMSIADVYDALKSKRCYKNMFSHENACTIIIEGSGTYFDPEIVKAFEEVHLEMLEVWEKMQ